jgi:hypothetical protein
MGGICMDAPVREISMGISRQLAVMAALAAFSGGAVAVGTIAEVSIYDRTENRALPVYRHQGRHYVVGKPGNEYQVRVHNRDGGEVLAVIAVDGVNAISGETASWEQTGYVLGSRQSYDVRGWRKSMERIAAFFFTEHDASYAARSGRPGNVGVIGVAVFRKKVEPVARLASPPPRRDRQHGAGSPDAHAAAESAADRLQAPAASRSLADSRHAPAPEQAEKKLGTGHGRSEVSHVTHADFERATAVPAEVITIYYDSHRNLVAQGVIRAPQLALPVPFPGQFVPDPQ